MKRGMLATVCIMIGICLCLTAARADAGKLTLVFIGGDADIETGDNNTFRNILIHHEDLQRNAEAFFIKSAMGDYTNATAMQRTAEAEKHLSESGVNVVAGYSHGGQSVYFMNTDLISEIFLLDGCVSIGGKCAEPVSRGRVWAEWILDTAKKGINIHVFASRGKHNEPSGAKNAIANLEKAAQQDPALVPLENGTYRVVDENQNEIALIETAILEGTHKNICITTEEQITQTLYALLHDAE